MIAEPTPSERVAAQFRQWVRDGVLPPGKELPSERQLASDLNTTRAVTRLAMGRLEQEGLIEKVSPRRRQVRNRNAVESSAPSLRQTIGVIVDDDFRHVPHQKTEGGWRQLVYQGAMDAVLDQGYAPLLIPIGLLTSGSELTAPAGLIVACRLPGRILAKAFSSSAPPPMAAYGDHQDWPDCDTVVSDHAEGGRQLVAWLARQGCRRLLLCHEPASIGTPWLVQREAGYRHGCADQSLDALAPEVIERLPKADYGEALFRESVRFVAGQLRRHVQGPRAVDALMAVSDGVVPQLTAACRLLGVEPGKQIRIVGYDNYWSECPGRRFEPQPPSATMDKQNYRIGQALGRLLHRRLSGLAPVGPERSLLVPRLIAPVGEAPLAGISKQDREAS